MRVIRNAIGLLMVCALSAAGQATDTSYVKSTAGLRQFDLGAIKARVLLDSAALRGGELEMVELTFPAGSAGGAHRHGRLEIIYVLEGEMDHVVNGVTHRLVPGSVGVVRTGDSVIHRVTSATAVRALVIWAPGGELPRLERR
jgi:quercetin dioxygenase-like cupin family protein